MSSTQAELLTGEQAKELILTLAGRLAAAMEAPAAERAKAEEKMMDTLVWYWPTVQKYTVAGTVKLPPLLAAGLSVMFRDQRLNLAQFNPADPALKSIVGAEYWDPTIDFSGYTARLGFWWRQDEGTGAAPTPGPSVEPAVAPPAQPTAGPSREPANSDSARAEPAPAPTVPAKRRLEADRPKGSKKPKKAVKSREMIEDSDADEEPLSTAATRRPKPRPTKQQPAKARAKKAVPGQGAGAGEAGPSNDKGKGKEVDRSSEPKPPYACDHCRNRDIECVYSKGVVCGRCQACHRSKGICTLNAKSLTTGKPMKGPAAEKKAVAFLAFTRRLIAEGKAVPGMALWDPRTDAFIADLETLDGREQGAHPGLIEWIRKRAAAEAEGKTLPEYKGEQEGKRRGKKQPGWQTDAQTDAPTDVPGSDGERPPSPPAQPPAPPAPTQTLPAPAPSPPQRPPSPPTPVPTPAPSPAPHTPNPPERLPSPPPRTPSPPRAPSPPPRAPTPVPAPSPLRVPLPPSPRQPTPPARAPTPPAPTRPALRAGGPAAAPVERARPLAQPDVRALEGLIALSPRFLEDFDAGNGMPDYVDVEDDDTTASTTKAAGKAKVDKGKGRARPLVRLGSPIDIDDDDEPVRPKKKPAPRPLFAKAVTRKATDAAAVDMAEIASLRSRVTRLAQEVPRLEGQLVHAHEELAEEKAERARLLRRVKTLEEELEQVGYKTEVLQTELDKAVAVRGEQEERIAEHEERIAEHEERIAELEAKALQFPDAQKIQGNVLEQVEEAWGARHQALTLSFQGMAYSVQERQGGLDAAYRRQNERNAQLEDRLRDLVAEEVRRLLQERVPKEETPDQGGVATPRAAASPAPPSTPRLATPAAIPSPAPPSSSTAFPPPPAIVRRQPPLLANTGRTLAGPSTRGVSTSPISALRREGSVGAVRPPIALRAFSVPPTPGYSSKADGGPVEKTWVSPAEQAKGKTKLVSEDRLRSQSVIAPRTEEAGSASAGPQPALPAVLEEGEILEEDGSVNMDTTD